MLARPPANSRSLPRHLPLLAAVAFTAPRWRFSRSRPSPSAQGIVSSTMTGIDTDSGREALAGATVTARHAPTVPAVVVALLGAKIDVNLTVGATELVPLSAFKLRGETNDLDSRATGAAAVITRPPSSHTAPSHLRRFYF